MAEKSFDPFGYLKAIARLEVKIDELTGSVLTLNRKATKIMGAVQVESDDLVQLDKDLQTVATSISDKLQGLIDSGSIPEGDLSELKADVETLRGLAAPAPVEPPTG